jgi:ribosomal protein S18 acetylase RimI-like enzyme
MITVVRITVATEFYLSIVNNLLTYLYADPAVLTMQDLEKCFSNPNFSLFIANNGDNQGVGMGSVFVQKNLQKWMAEIHDVVVHPNARGGGVGESIVKTPIRRTKIFAGDVGQHVLLSLTSRPDRVAANSLYKKLGFEMVAEATNNNGSNLYRMVAHYN